MAHKDIRIQFTVRGRRYEAVGFLKDGEPSIDGDSMLERTAGENGGAIGEEDEAFLRERLEELPAELRRYCLVTGRRSPGSPRSVSCFDFDSPRWDRIGGWLDYRWRDYYLVVRRCA